MFCAPILRASALAALAACAAAASGCTGRARPAPPATGLAGPSSTAAELEAAEVRAGELDAASARALGELPRQLGRFGLDVYAGVRAYGSAAPLPLERACEQILGPGCTDGQGLQHVRVLRYVDLQRSAGQGSRAALDVIVSRYEDSDGAFARFSDDLIGERDPEQLSARAIDVPGLAVIDAERVDGWIGRYVIALVRSDESEPLERRRAAAAADLPEAARQLVAALSAEPDLPLALQKLPRAHRLPLGLRVVVGDALGVPGVGSGALGYYRDGDKRWRVLTIVRSDAESARDVLSTLGQSPGARRIERAPFEAFAFTERRLPAEPALSWVLAQRQEVVYGIGDEAAVLPEFTSAEREAAVKLSLLDKLAKLLEVHAQ